MSRAKVVCPKALALALCVAAGTTGCSYRTGHGQVSSRVTPDQRATLPDGVGKGQTLRVVFPSGTPHREAMTYFTNAARSRGAHWLSQLHYHNPDAACAQPLMPETIAQNHDAVYHRKERQFGGRTEHSFERKQERVLVPYIRQIDDLDSIVEETTIWSSNNGARCTVLSDSSMHLVGKIHGRDAIGLLKAPMVVDLNRCGSSSAKQGTSTLARTQLILGDLSNIQEIEQTLPLWVGLRVTLAHGEQITSGILRRYGRQTMSIQDDGGLDVHVHVLDALAIETDGSPGMGSRPGSTQSGTSDDCKRWGDSQRDI